ncbi:MAG: hypothetical protein EOM50_01470 [Erysipelotrichia bacterium]|nr:hypothetical protein [Erysipelotrichia bacterium]NCC54731.1 hypothetical protein [Erysipelotrichia bacterium]
MEQLLKYKKRMIVCSVIVFIALILCGVYILQSILNNIHYSKSEAHVIALNQFPGKITSSMIEYENLQIFYELSIMNQQQEIIHVVIAAKDGKVISYEYE